MNSTKIVNILSSEVHFEIGSLTSAMTWVKARHETVEKLHVVDFRVNSHIRQSVNDWMIYNDKS
jgi:hypothetical protein